jgi:hypothetical protein
MLSLEPTASLSAFGPREYERAKKKMVITMLLPQVKGVFKYLQPIKSCNLVSQLSCSLVCVAQLIQFKAVNLRPGRFLLWLALVSFMQAEMNHGAEF